MTNDHRLAKLYGVKCMPFPLNSVMAVPSDFGYWLNRVKKLGVDMSDKEFFFWYSKVVKNDN